MQSPAPEVVTVTPNPAIDWTVEVPGFTPGAVNRVEGQRTRAGGKGVNVAAALAEQGVRVAATGFLGRGNSAAFEGFFAERGIADRFVRIAGETRVGIKVVDPVRRETTDVNFPGPASRPEDVRSLADAVSALAAGEPRPWVVLAGSLPPGVDPALYRELARTLKAAGCRVALDTSGEPLRHALDAAPHIAKPNLHELEALAGRPLPTVGAVVEAARALLERGVELAVVSMGAEGALFVERGGVVLARPPAVEVGSTVGAGDAMVAGVVAGRLRGLATAELARLATAFSLHALAGGAGDPSASVERWARRVEVRPVP
ncbi:MAG TPA: 1-phosphofructokinase [Longimicrobiaceae bacterium]|nr:1-phosphofructokinase [Longimicrobiaceae bacterium]